MLRIRDLRFERSKIWEIEDLRDPWSERSKILEIQDLRDPRPERSKIWEIQDLRDPRSERSKIWEIQYLRDQEIDLIQRGWGWRWFQMDIQMDISDLRVTFATDNTLKQRVTKLWWNLRQLMRSNSLVKNHLSHQSLSKNQSEESKLHPQPIKIHTESDSDAPVVRTYIL